MPTMATELPQALFLVGARAGVGWLAGCEVPVRAASYSAWTLVAEGFVQAFLVVPASHSAVASLTSSMHRQGLPRLINSDLEATLTARALS